MTDEFFPFIEVEDGEGVSILEGNENLPCKNFSGLRLHITDEDSVYLHPHCNNSIKNMIEHPCDEICQECCHAVRKREYCEEKGIVKGGGISQPDWMSPEEWEEFKRTAEYAAEVSHVSIPEPDDYDEWGR